MDIENKVLSRVKFSFEFRKAIEVFPYSQVQFWIVSGCHIRKYINTCAVSRLWHKFYVDALMYRKEENSNCVYDGKMLYEVLCAHGTVGDVSLGAV